MRWISQDPIGFAGGTSNLYQYEGDGPVNGLDPWGLQENYLPQILLDKIREDNRVTTRRIEELLKVLAREQEEQRVDANEKAAFLANGGSCQLNMSNFDLTGGAGLTPEPPWAEQLKTDPNAPPYKYSPIVTRVINGAITHEPENTQHLVPSELDSFTYASMAIPWATTGRFFGLGVNASSKTPVPRASVAGPKGDVYSVAFQTELKCSSYPGLTRASHFQEANENLLRMMETSRDFTQKMEGLGVNLQRTPTDLSPRVPPANWTWHHAQQPSVFELVPRIQHTTGSIFWDTMHPGGRGGYAIWGQK